MSEIDKDRLGNKIKQIRVDRKETLEQFAENIAKVSGNSIKTTKSNVSKWEKGLNVPNDIAIQSIAKLGGMSIDELIFNPNLEDIKEIIWDSIDSDVEGEVEKAIYDFLKITSDIEEALMGFYFDDGGAMITNTDEIEKIELEIYNNSIDEFLSSHIDEISSYVYANNPKSVNEVIESAAKYINLLRLSKIHTFEAQYRELKNNIVNNIPWAMGFYNIEDTAKRIREDEPNLSKNDAYKKAIDRVYSSKLGDLSSDFSNELSRLYNEYKNDLHKYISND